MRDTHARISGMQAFKIVENALREVSPVVRQQYASLLRREFGQRIQTTSRRCARDKAGHAHVAGGVHIAERRRIVIDVVRGRSFRALQLARQTIQPQIGREPRRVDDAAAGS